MKVLVEIEVDVHPLNDEFQNEQNQELAAVHAVRDAINNSRRKDGFLASTWGPCCGCANVEVLTISNQRNKM